MKKKAGRAVIPLVVVCFISLFMVSRTEGFDNIHVVQILLIFFPGVLIGLAIGIIRAARRNRSMQ